MSSEYPSEKPETTRVRIILAVDEKGAWIAPYQTDDDSDTAKVRELTGELDGVTQLWALEVDLPLAKIPVAELKTPTPTPSPVGLADLLEEK